MAENDLHLTKSHLLRKVLQRRVEVLENEKQALRSQIDQLEERLAFVSDVGEEFPSSAGLREIVARSMKSVREISRRAEIEAASTLRVARLEQDKLLEEMERLHLESERLHRMMAEALEGVLAIEERAQSTTERMLKNANAERERLTAELEWLFNGQGVLRPAIAQARQQAFTVQNLARAEVNRISTEAQSERDRLMDELQLLHRESLRLRGVMTRARQSALAIAEWTQMEASRLLPGEESQLPSPSIILLEKGASVDGHTVSQETPHPANSTIRPQSSEPSIPLLPPAFEHPRETVVLNLNDLQDDEDVSTAPSDTALSLSTAAFDRLAVRTAPMAARSSKDGRFWVAESSQKESTPPPRDSERSGRRARIQTSRPRARRPGARRGGAIQDTKVGVAEMRRDSTMPLEELYGHLMERWVPQAASTQHHPSLADDVAPWLPLVIVAAITIIALGVAVAMATHGVPALL